MNTAHRPIDRDLLREAWHAWLSNDNRPHPGPWWLAWSFTLGFCLVITVPFTVTGFLVSARGFEAWFDLERWAHWYSRTLVVSLCIGVLIHLLFDLTRWLGMNPARLRGWKGWQRTLFFVGTPMLGVAVGWPLGVMLANPGLVIDFSAPRTVNIMLGSVLLSLSLSLLISAWFAAKASKIDAERRATEAQLRLLQAQIEPHFLFNTLANVQSLMDHDLPKARQMLTSFTEYLRSSLGALRHEQGPLAQELELAGHYLQLQQARMEERLRFSIDVDEAAQQVPVPPLLLQPLVENAVVHGLEPSIDGGTVRVRARIDGPQLVLEVQDDGLGPDAPSRHAGRIGTGLALDNIRQRLRSRYGAQASLQLIAARPGTLARITLPVEAVQA